MGLVNKGEITKFYWNYYFCSSIFYGSSRT